jgi:hypothetical protein
MNASPFTPGQHVTYHPAGNRRPRPAVVVLPLARKVRVVDLAAGGRFGAVLREVWPANLTAKRGPRC